MPTDNYGAGSDPSDLLSSSTGTVGSLSTMDLLGMLSQVYGGNPFGARHTGVGGEERAYTYGDLRFLIAAGLTQNEAVDFIDNVITALNRQGVTMAQAGPAGLTRLIQQAWQDPNIRQQYMLALSTSSSPQSSVTSMVTNMLTGTGANLGTTVPTPFDKGYFGNLTETFKETPGELGNDYGMPQGSRVYSPFAGTITTEDQGKANWGKRVFVHLDNGWTIAIGHMHSFNVVNGMRVNPGDLLGLSGGALGDPSSGHSTGPHIEFQLIQPNGQYVDPRPFLQQLYKGVTFQQMVGQFGAGIYGQGIDPSQARNRLLGVDPLLEAKYGQVESLWQKYFGALPTSEQMMRVIGAGTTPAQWEDFIRGLPSHLPGIAIGAYSDIRSLADGAFQKVYGTPSNDTVVKELYDKGLATPAGIEYYVDQMPFQPGKHVDPIVFNTVWGSANEFTQGIWNQAPHPLDLESIWQKAGAPGKLSPSQASLQSIQTNPKLELVQGGVNGGS